MRFKTKRRTKNIDQVFTDLSTPQSIQTLKSQPMQEDKPGLGQHYCIECARYFQNEVVLRGHQKTKVHKRRVKLIKEGPYTQLEAEAAAGHNLQQFAMKKGELTNTLNGFIAPQVSLEKKGDHLKKNAQKAKITVNLPDVKDQDVEIAV